VIFSDAGPDVRWIGNERGLADETNWSTVDPDVVPYPGATGDAVAAMLQHGDPAGRLWRPGETDVSIRPGWFYHPGEDDRVRSPEELVDLYFTSVGRNSKLLLNVPPTRAGLLNDRDIDNLRAMRRRLTNMFAEDLAAHSRQHRRSTGARSAAIDIDLGRTVSVSIADLREDVTHGQVVARYSIIGSDGGPWQPVTSGTTIGFRKLDRFPAKQLRRVRLNIDDAVEPPRAVSLRLYSA
jgi:alpha-L-fucosidase